MVLIIDCDLRKPGTHKEFGVPQEPGLVSVLSGQATFAVCFDAKTGLYLLPAGPPTPRASEFLESEEMKLLLSILASIYDQIFRDSAPILAVADTRMFARLAGKAVYLVRWGKTRRGAAAAGLRQLAQAGADISGVLLTLVDLKKHKRYGYSDSGYYDEIKKYHSDETITVPIAAQRFQSDA